MRGKKGGAACGDQVEIKLTTAGQGVIETILPRSALLYRSDVYREKIIAANVTQMVIVVAAVPSFSEELINRCLAAAENQRIRGLIVLNKADLNLVGRYESHRRQYYDHRHYSRYGYVD